MEDGVSVLCGGEPALLQSWRAHGAAGEVCCADVAADGARLLTAGGDRALRLWRWRAAAGWEAAGAAPRAHRYGITCACWSPGGALCASGGVDGAARVWAARDLQLQPRRLLAAPGAPALRVLCWAGGGVLLCGYDDGAAAVWRVRDAALLARLQQHEGALHALAAPAGAALLITACTDGVLKVFDLQEVCRCAAAGAPTPAPLLWEDGAHDMGVTCCAASDDGRLVATGGRDARVRVWSVRELAPRVAAGAVLEGHGAAVTSLRWARGVVVSASLDRTARIWTAAGACLCVLRAHERYLTCAVPAPDLRYLLTGSNDKNVRMWSLGSLSLDDELETPCNALAHFGVGDLEGIGPVDDEDLLSGDAVQQPERARGAALLQYRVMDVHGGAVNCIAVHADYIATACSDGLVRVFKWSEQALSLQCELGTRGYPALAVDFSADGALLLAAGLDGAARLWDVKTGCLVRSLVSPQVSEHESGGGGARGARLWRRRLLLASDDGLVPLWDLADADPAPQHVYGGHVEAATCIAWGGRGRVAASGGAGGELRLHRAPLLPDTLASCQDAHDLGVQSVDFSLESFGASDEVALLASAGSDGLIKLWRVEMDIDGEDNVCGARLEEWASAMGHGGGALSVRWGAEGSLVTGGADGWARVWVVRGVPVGSGRGALQQLHAMPALGAAGTPAAAMLSLESVVLGSLSGELSVWRLPGGEGEGESESDDSDAELEPRWWGVTGVSRWIKDYITRPPGAGVSTELETALLQRVRDAGLRGTDLLDQPDDDLLQLLGYGNDKERIEEVVEEVEEVEELIEEEKEKEEMDKVAAAVSERVREELQWLRRPPPSEALSVSAPHWLLCPVSHRLQRRPVRAADGCTYDCCSLHEWMLAAEGPVSAVSGRVMRSGRVQPNYGATRSLRDFLLLHEGPQPADTDTGTDLG